MRLIITVVIILAALAGGFAIGMVRPIVDAKNETFAPVRQQLRFDGRQGYRSLLEAGWGKSQGWGTPLAAKKASVMIGFDGEVRGDVELVIEAKSQGEERDARVLVVRFNEAELGRWKIANDANYVRRRFVIPKDVVNKDTVGHLTLEYEGAVSNPSNVGLVSVELRDYRPRPGRRGFVDKCSPQEIVGWAVADKVGSTVVVKVNGKPLPHTFTSLDRDDLTGVGLPSDAGFVLTPKTPIPAGARIDIEFYDGRPLLQSPCSF